MEARKHERGSLVQTSVPVGHANVKLSHAFKDFLAGRDSHCIMLGMAY